jgi:hypothetical protein
MTGNSNAAVSFMCNFWLKLSWCEVLDGRGLILGCEHYSTIAETQTIMVLHYTSIDFEQKGSTSGTWLYNSLAS